MEFTCPRAYLDSAESVVDRIEKIDVIINSLYDAAERAAGSAEVQEYLIDDNQSKIKNIYRSVGSITQAIQDFEKIKTMYMNRYNRRSVVLKDLYSNK